MGINLAKGEKVELGQTGLTLGLGWDQTSSKEQDVDLDCSIFLLNEQKMLPTESSFIFYNNLKSPCGGVEHSGDCVTGETSAKKGDDNETIDIDLSILDPNIVELLIVVSAHDTKNFGAVKNSYIRIMDNGDNSEIAKYVLDEKFSIEKSIEFGRLYKIADKWKFTAVGTGYDEDLSYFVEKHYSGTVVK